MLTMDISMVGTFDVDMRWDDFLGLFSNIKLYTICNKNNIIQIKIIIITEDLGL
jgi:hypothetical protein